MKRLFYITCFLLLFSCSGENAWDCLQSAGDTIERAYTVDSFSKIRIEGEASLILRQGPEVDVKVISGENLFSDIQVRVEDNTLVINDANKCNLVREYGVTIAYVTTPNITEIRNSSSFNVEGDGILAFPELSLVSNTTGGIEDVRKGGDFILNIDCEFLRVSANGQSVFYISGDTRRARLSFSDEFPRFEGENLSIDRLDIFQVSANKMIVNPLLEITGEIRGTGDVISLNRPSIVEVEEFSLGRLIFQD